jgi:hypothetical protein
MERQDGPQTPFEVFCYDCRVTFPVGTRRCIHCGGPISRRGHAPERAAGPEILVEDGAPDVSVGRRLGGISLWVLLAVGAAVARMCNGG